jgi:anaphase-promoting complex subunit 1
MDATVSRALFLHLPPRHPEGFPEVDVSSIVQSAALVGVGMLYAGTESRLMSQILIEEMQRRPSVRDKPGADDSLLLGGVIEGREAYALAAGWSLGMVLLGKGRDVRGLDDLQLEQRLANLVRGSVARPPLAGADATLGIMEARARGEAGSRGPNGRSGTGGALDSEMAAAGKSANLVLLAANGVDLDVTLPAAALALALWFVGSGDELVASHLALPATRSELERVRPEHLAVLAVCRSFVLWDVIKPNRMWMEDDMPGLLRRGSARVQDIAQSRAFAVAGYSLGMGLRYAGTADAGAAAALRELLEAYISVKGTAGETGVINRETIETCAASCALALAAVMAGTGDLQCLKLFRALRLRVTPPTAAPGVALTYGHHTAVALALGLLFLGGGAMTLSNEPQAAACLLLALWPTLPTSSTDNRRHLQALRHFYVLAARKKPSAGGEAAAAPPPPPHEAAVERLRREAAAIAARGELFFEIMQ